LAKNAFYLFIYERESKNEITLQQEGLAAIDV
jgi:hypothetical protein